MDPELEAKRNKQTTYLINFILLLLISYLAYCFYEKYYLQKPAALNETELAKINDYGAEAYIGKDLKQLLPYDVKLPFVEGVFIVILKSGHMIFTMNSNVEVRLNDEVTIQFVKDGINILSGEININHPSGKAPTGFKVYSQGKLQIVPDLPATIR